MAQADWGSFNENLTNQLNSVMQYKSQQQKRQQEFNDAMQMMIMKAQIEQQMNPMQKLIDMGKVGEALKNLGLNFQDLGLGNQPIQQNTPMGNIPMGNNNLQINNQPGQIKQPNIRATKYEPTPFGGIRPTAFEPQEIPTAETGKAALALESIKNINDVRSILFPKGTPQSYRRGIAAGSNIPLSGLPLIPSHIGTYNPQTIFRKMGAALSGRQLIQTGVAARPEETAKLVQQFAPSGLMSSKSALEGLNELEDFYKTYLSILQTKGIEEADKWASSQSSLSNNNQKTNRIGKYTFE